MILGISGKKQSGKDTVGRIIQALLSDTRYKDNPLEYLSNYPNGRNPLGIRNIWEIKKFAYKVKQILSILTGIPIKDMEKEEVKNMKLGEEWGVYRLIKVDIEDNNKITRIIGLCTKEKHDEVQNVIKETGMCPGYSSEYYIPTLREALQYIGTDLFRDKFHPNTWTNSLFSEYWTEKEADRSGIRITHPNWLVTDVRFPNEAQAILDRKGLLIRVDRDYEGSKHKGWSGLTTKGYTSKLLGINQHKSETALDNYDKFHYVIENNGTIEELIEKVKQILIKEKLI